MNSLKLSRKDLFKFTILYAFLMPNFIGFTAGIGGTKYFGTMLVTMSVTVLCCMALLATKARVKRSHFAGALLCVFFFCALLLIAAIREDTKGIKDIFEFYRPIHLLIFSLFALSIDWNNLNLRRYLVRPFQFLFFFSIIFGLFEVFGGEFAHKIATILYKDDRPVLFQKATGFFGVTYFYATFMTFGMLFFLFKALLKIKRMPVLELIFFLLCLLCIALSQSRTAALAILFLGGYLIFFYGLYQNFPRKKEFYLISAAISAASIIGIASFFELIKESAPYLYAGLNLLFEEGISADGSGSANTRFQQLLWAYENQDSLPLLGAGIGKGTMMLESFYALFLYRFGLLGIAVIIGIGIYFLRVSLQCYQIARKDNAQDLAAFFAALHFFLIALPVLVLSSSIVDHPRLGILFFVLLAVCARYRYNYEKNDH